MRIIPGTISITESKSVTNKKDSRSRFCSGVCGKSPVFSVEKQVLSLGTQANDAGNGGWCGLDEAVKTYSVIFQRKISCKIVLWIDWKLVIIEITCQVLPFRSSIS